MAIDNSKICLRCAWRGNCAKRFAGSDDTTLHCPDFSEDVTLPRGDSFSPTSAADENR